MINLVDSQAIAKCTETCQRYEHVFTIIKIIFVNLNCAAVALTISFIVAGSKFISLDAFKLGQMTHLRDDVEYDMIIQGIFSFFLGISGIYIMCSNGKRKHQNLPIVIYAIVSLILGSVCIGKGAVVMVFEMVNEVDF